MDNLFAGIWPSPDEKEQSTVSYPAPDVLMGKSGSLPRWQLCRGISGSFRVEWVAGFVWNQWQPWSGIRKHITGSFVGPGNIPQLGLMKILFQKRYQPLPIGVRVTQG